MKARRSVAASVRELTLDKENVLETGFHPQSSSSWGCGRWCGPMRVHILQSCLQACSSHGTQPLSVSGLELSDGGTHSVDCTCHIVTIVKKFVGPFCTLWGKIVRV